MLGIGNKRRLRVVSVPRHAAPRRSTNVSVRLVNRFDEVEVACKRRVERLGLRIVFLCSSLFYDWDRISFHYCHWIRCEQTGNGGVYKNAAC